MKNKRIFFYCLAFMLVSLLFANSAQAHFTFGLQGGIFAPNNQKVDQRPVNQWVIPPNLPPLESRNVFGNTYEIAGFLGYRISAFELRIGSGMKNTVSSSVNTIYNYTEDEFKVITLDFNAIYHIRIRNKNIEPYVGVGAGINQASWKRERSDIDGTNWKTKSISYPVGANFIAGFQMPISSKFYFSGELKHSHIYKSWLTKNDVWNGTAYQDRNKNGLGGTSIKFGFGYNF